MRTTIAIPAYTPFLLVLLLSSACGGSAPAPEEVRLREVVLYQNGVGYFEREGRTNGGELSLSVNAHELDDVLTTLTIVAPNGEEGDAPAPSAVVPRGEASADEVHTLEVELGEAERDVRLSYATQTSAWRASYRMILPEERGEGEALLQGWAVVDNTTAEDWEDVSLTLATASPLSFSVDLRTPRIVERPNVTGHQVPPVAVGPVFAERAEQNDRDGDGLLDEDDLCVDDPEDLDQFEDEDGCPDLDQDGDRILDVDDMCPNDPEQYNGVEDEDGCPDMGRVVIESSALRILEHVYFQAGRAELGAGSRPIIEATAATLRGNPHIRRVEIRSHADARESDPWRLSVQRGSAVRQALVAAGVASERLSVEALGATEPLDPRNTAEARRRNRRVDFHVTEREARESRRRPSPGRTRPTRPTGVRAAGASRALRRVPLPRAGANGTRYVVSRRVSVPAGESAMVAMLNAPVSGEDVLLFRTDPAVPMSAHHPFRAARLKNQSDVDLVSGPVSLFARGEFIGEGLIDGLLVGQNAFIPYALDEATRVEREVAEHRTPLRVVGLRAGQLAVEDTETRRTRFDVTPGARTPARIFLRVARGSGFTPHEPPRGTVISHAALLVPARLREGRREVVVAERRVVRGSVDLVRDLGVDLEPYLAGGVPESADAERLRALVEDRAALADLHGRVSRLHVRLGENAARTSELRRSVASLAEAGASVAPVRRRLARQLETAVQDGEQLAADLATLRAEEAEARDRLRQAVRDFVIE